MWAQLITTRLKPGREGDLAKLADSIHAIEQPGSGLIRTLAMQGSADPGEVRILAVFESEEAARARESDPARIAAMGPARELMAEIFDGPMEFSDLTVIDDYVP